jgi:hypothetical protein
MVEIEDDIELDEYRKHIGKRIGGRVGKVSSMSYGDGIMESGLQVVEIGRYGRYRVFIGGSIGRHISYLKVKMNRIMELIKSKKKSSVEDKARGERELGEFLSSASMRRIYDRMVEVGKGMGIKFKEGEDIKTLVGNIKLLEMHFSKIVSKMEEFSGIVKLEDGDSDKVMIDNFGSKKMEVEGIVEEASGFFDRLGVRVGRNIPVLMIYGGGTIGTSGGGTAIRSHHYIEVEVGIGGVKGTLSTLVHETGHYMWFYSMSREMRSVIGLYYFMKVDPYYSGEYSSKDNLGASLGDKHKKGLSKYGGVPELPSSYSMHSPTELWAEMIRYFMKGEVSYEMRRLMKYAMAGDIGG